MGQVPLDQAENDVLARKIEIQPGASRNGGVYIYTVCHTNPNRAISRTV